MELVLAIDRPGFEVNRLHQWLSGKGSACDAGELEEARVQSLSWEDSLEKEMATHSGSFAWKTP